MRAQESQSESNVNVKETSVNFYADSVEASSSDVTMFAQQIDYDLTNRNDASAESNGKDNARDLVAGVTTIVDEPQIV